MAAYLILAKIYSRCVLNALKSHAGSFLVIAVIIAAIGVMVRRYYLALPSTEQQLELSWVAALGAALAAASLLRLWQGDENLIAAARDRSFARKVAIAKLALAMALLFIVILIMTSAAMGLAAVGIALAAWFIASLNLLPGNSPQFSRFSGTWTNWAYLAGFEKTFAIMVNSGRYFVLLGALVIGVVVGRWIAATISMSVVGIVMVVTGVSLYYFSSGVQDELEDYGRRYAPRYKIKSALGEWLFWFSHFLVTMAAIVSLDSSGTAAELFFGTVFFIHISLLLFAHALAKYLYPGQRFGQLIFLAISAMMPITPFFFAIRLLPRDPKL